MVKQRLEYAIKHYSLLQWVYRNGMSFIIKTIGLFIKTDSDLVLYNSMIGRANYDSPKAIFDYLKNNPKYSHLKHVWAFNDPESVNYEGCQKIRMDSINYFITALRAKYWVTNVNIERGLHFKKLNTRYLNTWHGLSFNHIGNDVPGRKDYDSRNTNFICYESEYHKKILIHALRANESSMIATGLPRNDELYKVTPEEVLSLKKELGLPLDKKIIMYAPTWRESTNNGKEYELAPPINFSQWKKELGDEYCIVLRTHHLTTKLLKVKFDDFVRDFTHYPRINDLFKVSDILISDYSACMADFSILERPVICFAYDYDSYSSSRGLYIDFEKEFPGGICRTENEVLNRIKTMDYAKEKICTGKRIKEKFTNIGGCATQKCVEYLFAE